MKSALRLSVLVIFLVLFGMNKISYSQTKPVLYFCEKYDRTYGEIGVSDRFTTGYITVMIKADDPLGITNCSIQYDKLNYYSGEFEYYKKFKFVVKPSMNYIYFSKNDNADMNFEDPGIYRVYLLNSYNETVTSSLIEIIPN